jgi:hypothetical protein
LPNKVQSVLNIVAIVCVCLLAAAEIVVRLVGGAMAVVRVYLHRDYSYLRWLRRDLSDCHSILELGCGSSSPILKIGLGARTDTVDIFQPYVDMHNKLNDYRGCRQADILSLKLPEQAYDAVVMLDVLEHLPKNIVEEVKLFEAMERCARKRVILFVPNGFVENDEVDMDPYQKHVSAWEPSLYKERGYTVHGATSLRWIMGKAALPRHRPYSMWAIIAMLSMRFVYNRPELAWHSYAVKEVGL